MIINYYNNYTLCMVNFYTYKNDKKNKCKFKMIDILNNNYVLF